MHEWGLPLLIQKYHRHTMTKFQSANIKNTYHTNTKYIDIIQNQHKPFASTRGLAPLASATNLVFILH